MNYCPLSYLSRESGRCLGRSASTIIKYVAQGLEQQCLLCCSSGYSRMRLTVTNTIYIQYPYFYNVLLMCVRIIMKEMVCLWLMSMTCFYWNYHYLFFCWKKTILLSFFNLSTWLIIWGEAGSLLFPNMLCVMKIVFFVVKIKKFSFFGSTAGSVLIWLYVCSQLGLILIMSFKYYSTVYDNV